MQCMATSCPCSRYCHQLLFFSPKNLLPDSEDHAAINLSCPQPVKHVIDRLERQSFDGRLDLAFGSEHERFLQVQACSHNRSADGVAVQNHVEDRNRKLARRQTIQHTCSAATQHAN